jgi:hypothetical protein
MRPSPELLGSLAERFSHAVIVFVDENGYPLSVATDFEADAERGVVKLRAVAGEEVQPPHDEQVNVVFSHIRPQPGWATTSAATSHSGASSRARAASSS